MNVHSLTVPSKVKHWGIGLKKEKEKPDPNILCLLKKLTLNIKTGTNSLIVEDSKRYTKLTRQKNVEVSILV